MYPPLIKDVQPSFVIAGPIDIHYEDNPAEGFREDIILMIKEYVSSDLVATIKGTGDGKVAKFNIKNAEFALKKNQNYKAQIAYYTEEDQSTVVGTYSSVAIIKCLEQVAKTTLDATVVDSTGIYTRWQGVPALYSYWFELTDSYGMVIDKTEEKLWLDKEKKEKDGSYSSTCIYTLTKKLNYLDNYTLSFHTKDVEGLEAKVSKTISRQPEVDPLYELAISAEPNADDGYIEVKFSAKGKTVNGQFIIERTDEKEATYERLIVLKTGVSFDTSWRDTTVEQGKKYKYSIRQFKGNTSSIRVSTPFVSVDFEDMFLTDGERQLKIRFNPKVSSFKTTLQETKSDTIGGKYPIFYRNDSLAYKEIPISGLISYRMDENGMFAGGGSENSETRTSTPQGVLAAGQDEYAREREFKLNVLDWLNNGEKKFFRSPQEGNYIVRITNVSLSPEDTLGRMLHSFSCTAYEVAEPSYENLKEMGVVNWDPDVIKWETKQYSLSKESFIPYSGREGYFFNIGSWVKNIVWETVPLNEKKETYLQFMNEFFQGGLGTQYYNVSGIWVTPKEEVYPGISVQNVGVNDFFTVDTQVNRYDWTRDTLEKVTITTKWYTTKEKEGPQSTSSFIYTLQVYGTGVVTLTYSDGSINTIQSDNNQIRTYTELSNVVSITATNDAYASWLQKEVTSNA